MCKNKFVLFICSILVLLTGCSIKQEDQSVELTVSAAASLTGAMEDIVHAFEAKYPEIDISLNLGSSGALQQQISQGAPIDLFLSAAEDQFNYLNKNNFIDNTYQDLLLNNKLVLIKKKDSPNQIKHLEDLIDDNVRRIALGTPESVPAGMYAKQALEHVSLFQLLDNKFIYAKDVRQVLHYVETGSVDLGFVYLTDKMKSNQVETVEMVDSSWHDPINYPIGIIKETEHKDEAIIFYNFLHGKKAKNIFEAFGFTLVRSEKSE
ncbi:Molybdate-binding periplasmic protein precursor [Paraliobacillus sp. PM-2]|uniref:molybdate ABC transporter substrate-binding protein n=1 Tax=Paraliobacillus sp. PM-2 TaxID=1462524 RepID=UPI00061C046F|nr:molybdate ABC transporter substrate-binding protein [Paraliobacillus sp. PM-2]CQR47342.1 Molybdate-binding periplasmic protein precursor [Paraliobacillus sp. PM-2]